MPRFKKRQAQLMDFVGRFEADSSSTHVRNALGAIERLKDDGAKFWNQDSSQLSRWKDGCTALWAFLNTLGKRRNVEKQDLATALREFIHEFEHSTWRMYQMLYGTLEDPDNDSSIKQMIDWFDLVYKLSTYALISAWIDDKMEEVSVSVTVSMTTRRIEKWTRKDMQIPKNYRHASKDM